jgi:hypothetical protein
VLRRTLEEWESQTGCSACLGIALAHSELATPVFHRYKRREGHNQAELLGVADVAASFES